MTELKLSSLTPAAYNPREISPDALEGLKYSLEEFGDLSGITFNKRTKNLIAAHQRIKALQERYGDLSITAVNENEGVILTPDGNKFHVRFVDWPKKKERAANIAANSPTIQGQFTTGVFNILSEMELDMPDTFGKLNLDSLDLSNLNLSSLAITETDHITSVASEDLERNSSDSQNSFSKPVRDTQEAREGKEFDESVADNFAAEAKFTLKVPMIDAERVEAMLTEIVKQFPQAKLAKTL